MARPDPECRDQGRQAQTQGGGAGTQPEDADHVGHHRLVRVVDDAAAQTGVSAGQPPPEPERGLRRDERAGHRDHQPGDHRGDEGPGTAHDQQQDHEDRRRQLHRRGERRQHAFRQQAPPTEPRTGHQVQHDQGDQEDAQLAEGEGLGDRLDEPDGGRADQAEHPAVQPEAVQHGEQREDPRDRPADLHQRRRQQGQRHGEHGRDGRVQELQRPWEGVEVAALQQHATGAPVDVQVDHDRPPRHEPAAPESRGGDVEPHQDRQQADGDAAERAAHEARRGRSSASGRPRPTQSRIVRPTPESALAGTTG